MKKLSQNKMLLMYLKEYKSITALEALKELGSLRLAARINDLRTDGHNIITETAYIGKGPERKRIAKYKLVLEK